MMRLLDVIVSLSWVGVDAITGWINRKKEKKAKKS